MAKKYKNGNQPMLKTLSDSFMSLSFALTLALLLIYGFTKRLFIWLIALSSFSWFALSGIFLFVLLTDKSVLIKKDAFYKGKPISQKEAAFFGYVYAGIFLAIGTILAFLFFRELCG